MTEPVPPPTHLFSPLQDGLLLQKVAVVEGLEDERHAGQQQLRVLLAHQNLKRPQQRLLRLAVVHHKLQGEGGGGERGRERGKGGQRGDTDKGL